MQPRLLASTGALLMCPLGWTLEVIAEAGFPGAELVITQNADTRQPETVVALAERAGIEVPVVHGPYMLLLRTVFGANYEEKTRRSLELAGQIGAGIMVAHAPYRWEGKARRWLESAVHEEAARLGTSFAMENLFPVAGRNFSCAVTPEELMAYPNVVFDTSHFAVSGIDLFSAWDTLRDRVCHLHLSDNLGNGRDSHAPLGTGVLPLERFLGHVGASGYSGTITLELDLRAHLDDRDTLVAFLAAERGKAERYLAGDPHQEPAVMPL